MSDFQPDHGHSKPQSHTGGDMNLGKIMIVGLASLALFAVGIVWAYRIMVGRESDIAASTGMAKVPTEIGKSEIGIVDQVLFSTDHRLEDWHAENAKRLSSYGWVDRSKGVARIPIEKAMELVIASPPDIAGEGVPPVAKLPAAAKAPAAEKAPAAAPAPAKTNATHPDKAP